MEPDPVLQSGLSWACWAESPGHVAMAPPQASALPPMEPEGPTWRGPSRQDLGPSRTRQPCTSCPYPGS